jgi:hypothetical protein
MIEKQYTKEIGHPSRTVMISEGYTADYVEWLEKLYDIEHRRRVAAEKVILCRECYVDRVTNELIKNWQSIIKERVK